MGSVSNEPFVPGPSEKEQSGKMFDDFRVKGGNFRERLEMPEYKDEPEFEYKDEPELEPKPLVHPSGKKPEYIDKVQRRPFREEILHELPRDNFVANREIETIPDMLLMGAPLITQADIDARVVKAFTGVGLTAETARMVMESMRQEGIVYTILSL